MGKSGYLYVVRFSTDVVKVGQSKTRMGRVNDHADMAHKMGISVTASWISRELDQIGLRERSLIATCRMIGKARTRGTASEYFSDLEFGQAVALAEELEGSAEIPIKMVERLLADHDCSVTGCYLPATDGGLCKPHRDRLGD